MEPFRLKAAELAELDDLHKKLTALRARASEFYPLAWEARTKAAWLKVHEAPTPQNIDLMYALLREDATDDPVNARRFEKMRGAITVGAQNLFERRGRVLLLAILRQASAFWTNRLDERRAAEEAFRQENQELLGEGETTVSAASRELAERCLKVMTRLKELEEAAWQGSAAHWPPDVAALLRDVGLDPAQTPPTSPVAVLSAELAA